MRNIASLSFSSVWVGDFEFTAPPGESPRPICLVAHEVKTGRRIRLFGDALTGRSDPPYPTDETALFVTYYGSAEAGCHLALGWPPSVRHLDLYAEYRCVSNGADLTCGSRGLLGALTTFGLPAIDVAEKEEMRRLAMRGGPYNCREESDLLDYCESDVVGTGKLLEAMLPQIDLPRALLRGRYQTAAARMERTGVPIDVEMQRRLLAQWDSLKLALVQSMALLPGERGGTDWSRAIVWLRDGHVARALVDVLVEADKLGELPAKVTAFYGVAGATKGTLTRWKLADGTSVTLDIGAAASLVVESGAPAVPTR